jgi:hypothetical protein
MNEQRLAQLLRHADSNDATFELPDVSAIATNARTIRRQRQSRTRLGTAALSMLVVVGSVVSMISWRNVHRVHAQPANQSLASREQIDQLDSEIEQRMSVIQAMSRPTTKSPAAKSPAARSPAARSPAAKSTKSKLPARDVGMELDIQRERAAAIILQAADQLRDANRSDFANDRYHDLISLFPDTAAAQLARERIEQAKNRT